jgi:trimeric autotransporter adhesin
MATFNGTKLDDRLHGFRFDDVINGFEGDDELNGYDGRDELNGGDGDDDLFGGDESDVLNGGLDDDRLDGGAGADTMAGGMGNDLYQVDNISDLVSEAKNEGSDTIHATISYTLPSNVESLWLVESSAAVNGTGNSSHNYITGNSRDNTLSGEAGHDMLKGGGGNDLLIGGSGDDYMEPGSLDMSADGMVGGFGNDTYSVFEADDEVIENGNEGIDEVRAFTDYTLAAHVENLTLCDLVREGTGNELDNVIYGNGADNWLRGAGGNDTLYGLGGDDRMVGGTGDDTFYGVDANDDVFEYANEGTDQIVARTSYTLPQYVEVLSFTESYSNTLSVNGTGNWLDNLIYGTDGINVLMGMDGDDRLYGYGGIDVLTGNEGHDTLDGGTGADVMIGGTENDSYLVDDAGDVVTEAANEGADSVDSLVAYVLGAHVEDLDLRGDADIDGTGNDLDNFIGGNAGANVLTGGAGNDTFDGEGDDDTINGGEGNDTIDGGLGADTMAGGLGDDFFYVIDAGNTIVENANEGTDTVQTRVTHTLAANVENLTLHTFGGAIDGTGNSLVNVITGNDDNNVLSGMAGNDTLMGGDGIDQLFGGAGNDMMEGGIGDDILDGGISNDTLIGGVGVDLLTGGGGVDRFQFNWPTEGGDVIADFATGTDRVYIDDAGFGIAGTGTLAANGVAFVPGAAATSASATLMFDAATHQLLWDADGTGAASAELLATMVGVNAMSATDFLIV